MADEMDNFAYSEDEEEDYAPSDYEEAIQHHRLYRLYDDGPNFDDNHSVIEWNGDARSDANFVGWVPNLFQGDNDRLEFVGDIDSLPSRSITRLDLWLPSSWQGYRQGCYRHREDAVREKNQAFWKKSCEKMQQAMTRQSLNEICVRMNNPEGPHDAHLSTLLEHLPSQLSELRLVIIARGRDPPTFKKFDLAQSFRTLKECQSLQTLFLNDTDNQFKSFLNETSKQMFANALEEGLSNLKNLTIFEDLAKKECVLEAIRTKPSLHSVSVHTVIFNAQLPPGIQEALQTFPRINAALGNKSVAWADPNRLKEFVEAMISARDDFVTFHYILHTMYENGFCIAQNGQRKISGPGGEKTESEENSKATDGETPNPVQKMPPPNVFQQIPAPAVAYAPGYCQQMMPPPPPYYPGFRAPYGQVLPNLYHQQYVYPGSYGPGYYPPMLQPPMAPTYPGYHGALLQFLRPPPPLYGQPFAPMYPGPQYPIGYGQPGYMQGDYGGTRGSTDGEQTADRPCKRLKTG